MREIIYKEDSYKIVGAAMEVHKHLGCGFLEQVYQEALELEFLHLNIPYEREKQMNIYYRDKKLSKYYIADFICFDKIILELKALSELTSEHEAQLINYLKTTNMRLGILLNFGTESLEYKRILNKHYQSTNYANFAN